MNEAPLEWVRVGCVGDLPEGRLKTVTPRLTIAGPGATNLLTGLWDAKVDRAPVLALTGPGANPGLRAGCFPGHRPEVGFPGRVALLADRPAHVEPR